MNLDAPPESPWSKRPAERPLIGWDDPIPEPETYPENLTAELAALRSWHHDHYQPVAGSPGAVFFRKFTGQEPMPAPPAGFARLSRLAALPGSDPHDFHGASARISREVHAARRAWAAAGHDALVLRILHDATPAMNNYRNAVNAVRAAYAALTAADDNRWRAGVAALVDARAHARNMARAVDRHSDTVAASYRDLPDGAYELTDSHHAIARRANIDIRDVWPTGDDQTVERQLDALIAGQDARIAEILRLSPPGAGAGAGA